MGTTPSTAGAFAAGPIPVDPPNAGASSADPRPGATDAPEPPGNQATPASRHVGVTTVTSIPRELLVTEILRRHLKEDADRAALLEVSRHFRDAVREAIAQDRAAYREEVDPDTYRDAYGSASEDGASEDESPSSHVDERHQSSKRRRKRPILRLWLPNFVSSPARLDWARRRGALERSHADAMVCPYAAGDGELQTLRFAREELRLPCDSVSFSRAAEGGHLHCLRYLHENGCPKSRSAFSMAAKGGHLHVLEYLRIEMGLTPDPTDEGICETAARQGRRDILEWAHSNFGCAWGRTCEYAAAEGHLACLQYAHENGCWWNFATCREAAGGGHLDCLRYAHTNGCLWDQGTISASTVMGHLECVKYAYENGLIPDRDIFLKAERFGHQHILEWLREETPESEHIVTHYPGFMDFPYEF